MYDVGDSPVLSVTVRDANGTPANATTVTLTITAPDGSVVVNGVTVAGVGGVYSYSSYTSPLPGRYLVYWVATGSNACAFTDVFVVNDTASPGLVSLQDAKDHLQITSTTFDEELRRMIAGASNVIETLAGPIAVQTFTDVVCGNATILLTRQPVVSITSITGQLASSPTILVSDLLINPSGVVSRASRAGFYNLPYTVVYKAGFSAALPQRFVEATLVQLAHMWETQRGGSVTIPGVGGDESDSNWRDQSHIAPRVHEILVRDLNTGFA